jgi:methyl coenzyme M reductase subunit D
VYGLTDEEIRLVEQIEDLNNVFRLVVNNPTLPEDSN